MPLSYRLISDWLMGFTDSSLSFVEHLQQTLHHPVKRCFSVMTLSEETDDVFMVV